MASLFKKINKKREREINKLEAGVGQAERSIRATPHIYQEKALRLLGIKHGGMKRGYFHGESLERPDPTCY